ncbi:MAG TPA: DNA translocase FtsK, partial [Thalassobaculum sp.]
TATPVQRSLDLGPTGDYAFPALELLAEPSTIGHGPDEEALEQNARMLESVLQDFGVKGTIGKVRYGPVVTLYELEPAPGTKSSRVIGLSDDIARSMSAVSVRVAVVPGRNVIGIELPNSRRETVYLREILESDAYSGSGGKLTIALGKDIGGSPVAVDLARMPHLLIAGTTGSGKSVAVNTMILSLLYRMPPERCRFIMVDPKMLELSVYDGIPHLLSPVVTDPKKAVVALKWTVREMESRYRAMSKLGVRNIEGYNARLAEAVKKGETLKRRVQTGFDADTGKPVFEEEPLDLTPLPFIVVVIDEVADLMLVAGKDIEGAVQRLAQMARAAGIHVIMATQRPSVDVITGTIKANFPTRISFQVTSKIDSRTILGEQGAEQLLGQGDMLYMAGGGRITRVHGPFCSDEEVEDVVRHLKSQGEPEYDDSITEDDEGLSDLLGLPGGETGGSGDDLYDQAVAIVSREGKCSTSFIQRHLKIGYNRAATIVERMESEGVVSQANHVGKREVLVGDHSER